MHRDPISDEKRDAIPGAPRDPIVEEVHRVREQMWDECGGDLDRLIEFLRAGEAEHRERIITPEELDELRRKDRPGPARTGPRGLPAEPPLHGGIDADTHGLRNSAVSPDCGGCPRIAGK